MNSTELKSIATQVRRDIVRMVHAVQSGHPGVSGLHRLVGPAVLRHHDCESKLLRHEWRQ